MVCVLMVCVLVLAGWLMMDMADPQHIASNHQYSFSLQIHDCTCLFWAELITRCEMGRIDYSM